MKSLLLIIIVNTSLIGLLSAKEDLVGPAHRVFADAVFTTLAEEMERSLTNLQLGSFAPPYYIGYSLRNASFIEVEAKLGGLVRSSEGQYSHCSTDVRVGDYELDNSYFVPRDVWAYRPSGYNLPIDLKGLPLLHRALWWMTDDSYKQAVELYSRKKTTLLNRPAPDRQSDFRKVEVHQLLETPTSITCKKATLEEVARRVSAIFLNYPAILDHRVWLSVEAAHRYFLNSEGSMFLRDEPEMVLLISAFALSRNGQLLQDHELLAYRTCDELPNFEDLSVAATSMALRLTQRVTAPVLDKYIGPVLFTGQAAAEVMLQLLGARLTAPPPYVFEDESSKDHFQRTLLENPFAGRIGLRVLPDGFRVYDDPTLTTWRERPLIGCFAVDDEGVPARSIELVKDGRLKTLLATRHPAKNVLDSPGHARFGLSDYAVGCISNLFVEPKNGVSTKKLRSKLVKLCKEMGLAFGLEVRRIHTPSMSYFLEQSASSPLRVSQPSSSSMLGSGLEVYKLYPDGREELVQGAEFQQVTVRSLRDIIASSKERILTNTYLALPDVAGHLPVSIITPDLLVEEMELETATGSALTLILDSH